jgi:biotin carboxyl carrier protein
LSILRLPRQPSCILKLPAKETLVSSIHHCPSGKTKSFNFGAQINCTNNMAEVILMPRLSDTMTEGVIAAWHKKVGDTVKKGDLLADVETDKATMELESYKDGTLLHIGADKGGKLQVNDLLAIIGNPGEDISQHLKGGGQQQDSKEEAAPAPTQTAAPAEQPQASSQGAMDLSKMEEVVLMPRLSDTMTEGVIAAWHKKVGDDVKKGECSRILKQIKQRWNWKAIRTESFCTRELRIARK